MLGTCWLISRAESRPLGAYGIGNQRWKDFLPGAIWGVVSMSLLVALLHQLHFLSIDGRLLHGASILRWGAAWFFAFLLVGFCEEYEFRGYLQYTLMRGVWGAAEQLAPANPHVAAFWIAATIMSLTFGGLHILNGGENFFGILQVFFIGMVFSYALWRTGSLWWGVGFHAVWDWSQSFLFGVADSGNVSVGRLLSTHPIGKTIFSGGSDGPEGSIFAAIFVFLTLVRYPLYKPPGHQAIPRADARKQSTGDSRHHRLKSSQRMTSIPPEANGPLENADPTSSEPRWLTRGDTSVDAHREHPRPTLFAHLSRFRKKRPAHEKHILERFHLHRLFLVLGVLLAIAAFTLISTAMWLRHAMHASMPQLDGAMHAPGLSAPVTVTSDAQGVPSIQAANLDDLLFAQGFITAQDRLWQMDLVRRHASGQLAEILGPNLVPHDRLQRTLQLTETADRAVKMLAPDQLHQLEAYARGVNAFIAQATGPHNGHLPVEFHLLHYTPAPWAPRDTLLVSLAMFQDLSTQFPVKLSREALAAHLSPQQIADLYPVGSWRDHPPTQPPPDLTTPVPEVEQIPLDRSQSKLQPPQLANPTDLLALSKEFPGLRCAECRAGSNNWPSRALVRPRARRSSQTTCTWRSPFQASGTKPRCNAPATATTPAIDVAGFTLPGVPFVIVGRNQHVAWGFTNLGGDVQDVRIEHLRGTGSNMQFQSVDGSWQPVGHHPQHIKVRFGHDVDFDVLSTTEHLGQSTMSTRAAGVSELVTPIITPLLNSDHRALSLAWTFYDPTIIVARSSA